MLHCTKNNDGSWQASVRVCNENGVSRRLSRRCESKAEALRWLKELTKPSPDFNIVGFPNKTTTMHRSASGGIIDDRH